jgi:EAL domain-containing protein (putative c-di-GMP-specific phosphodiesterase class I)/DNA-binding response OmpR family regulator
MKDNQPLPMKGCKLDLTAARILVVDDNPGNPSVLLERLSMEGYTDVTAESDPLRAVALWREKPFDLLLLDVRMPEMDCCQVMSALKQSLDVDDYLPCIVLTTQTDQEIRQAVLDAGAIDFIVKPFEFGEVLKRIKTAINTRLLHQRKRQQLSDFGQRLDEQARELRAKEHDLAYLAAHDSVTGLLNRRALTGRLNELVKEYTTGCSCALLEVTNTDQLLLIEGVESVDFFLRTVSSRLKMAMDDHFGICGVWGGQTFLCALPFAGEAAGAVFNRVAKAVFAPVVDFDVDVMLHGRGGYSSVRSEEFGSPKAIDATVRRAGFALASQHKRGNRVVEFNQIMEDTALRRNLVERELNLAMGQEHTQFFLQFQPKVDLTTETIVGCEALLRWLHPDLGFIPPAEFIPIAEEKGQIEELGLIVIEQALQFIRQMQSEVGCSVRVAVNISGVQFELMRAKGRSLVDEIQILLTKYEVAPQMLELEITESVLMIGFDWVVAKLHRLRDMGISVALDDFGTGYSSFAYLQNLPISTLKIDRTFVDNAANMPRQAALLGSIVRMAQDLGLTTVAEGVETLEDIELLRQFNCPIAQGYYYSRPLMPDDFITLLRQPSCARAVP